MVSVLVSRSSGPDSSPGLVHCVVFLEDTLLSQCLHPERKMCASKPEDNVLSSILPPVFLT